MPQSAWSGTNRSGDGKYSRLRHPQHNAPASAGVFQTDPDAAYQQFSGFADCRRRSVAIQNLGTGADWLGRGRVPDQVFNRRWRMKPGTIKPNPFGQTNDLVRMNPPVGQC
jgi:hypothetical protein